MDYGFLLVMNFTPLFTPPLIRLVTDWIKISSLVWQFVGIANYAGEALSRL